MEHKRLSNDTFHLNTFIDHDITLVFIYIGELDSLTISGVMKWFKKGVFSKFENCLLEILDLKISL